MAERTQIEQLDTLIDRFEQTKTVYLSGADIDKPVSQWRHCDDGNAACHAISETFVDFLADHDIDGSLSDAAAGPEFASTPDQLGYSDRPLKGAPWHTTALVYYEDKVFSIDWSAHQFGYDEFPLVQLYDPAASRWLRAF